MQPSPEMLAALGITREDVLNCTARELAKQILGNDDGGEYEPTGIDTRVMREVAKFIDAKVVEGVDRICRETIAPLIQEKLDAYTFQETNRWGEKLGRTLTFTEFLVARIDAFMREDVDRDGNTFEECRARSRSFDKIGPRITQAIHQHFKYQMETAMKQILADSSKILTESIEQAAKNAMGTIQQRLVAKIEVGR